MSEIDTYYITGGYVLSSIPVTLHLTYGHSDVSFEDFPDEMNQALSNTPQDSPIYAALAQSVYGLNTIMASRSTNSLDTWTIGARWDIRPKIALKADVTFLQGDKNEAAMFQDIEDGFDRKAQLYQVALEWVF